jgi:hypothetical protein
VDTDIFIDYFNAGLFSNILEHQRLTIYYSSVTEKELLTKKGLKVAESEAISYTLKKCRRIRLDSMIALKYSELRLQYPTIDREDALIAATALVKNLPLLTRNLRHFKKIKELRLVGSKFLHGD